MAFDPSSPLIAWLSAAAHNPFGQAAAIILGTFILEDGATILTAIAVGDGTVGGALALVSLYIGIITGDAGLYGLGRLAALWPAARRWAPSSAKNGAPAPTKWWKGRALFRVIFLSRFIPGTRLPIYTASGFFNAGFGIFILATAIATLFWTTSLFALSLKMGQILLDELGAWRWAGIAGFIAAIVLVGRQVARMQPSSSRG
ncbi:DedA family protein [Acetobacter conturbans]|uniref:DedA family protein n=1 Tax=Acetobacter conturbans TaxID=1737472 RepID=A0ABX0JW32_9PROT|nr:hypothetical protein [Acetobacter conturbans]NHN87602.1 hypothetical protein [Acetobacter conturbans]